MRALRWHGPRDLRIEDVPAPRDPAPDAAIVKVVLCGICGTDLHEYAHGPAMIRPTPHPLTGKVPPVTMGHEASGRIVALGEGVGADFAIGDRVVIDPCLRCGECPACVRGDYHICHRGGSIGFASDGAFAEYVEVAVTQLDRIPDGVSDEVAAMAEPLAVGLHAVTRSGLRVGETVLIVGAGPIGIATLLSARAAGASAIYVSEPNASRRAAAIAAGATEVFDPAEVEVRREVYLKTHRTGPDVAVDATGIPSLIETAVSAVRRGGRVVVAGLGPGAIDLDVRSLVLYERTVMGSLGYNRDIPRVLDLVAAGRLDATPLLSAVHPLHDALAVFEELDAARGAQLKVLLSMEGV